MPPSVLIVGPAAPPYGGMSLQATALVERLQHENIAVEFVATNPPLPAVIERLLGVRTLIQTLLFVWNLGSALTRRRVVHLLGASHWYFVLRVIPAVLLGKCFGRKVILNYRGGEARVFFARRRRLILPLLRLVDDIAVPSAFLQRVFSGYGFAARIIPNFVDLERFKYRQRDKLKPHLLVNRNLDPLYNVEMAIEAYSIIKAKYQDARLDVVGNGSEEKALRIWVHEHGVADVHFHGAVPNADIPDYLDKADILLNPSNADNMPISLLEAFAAGVPVVTTNVGGIPDLVGSERAALLVEPGDKEAMALGIEVLLQNSDEVARLTRAAKRLCDQTNWQRVGRLWLAIYDSDSAAVDVKNADAIH